MRDTYNMRDTVDGQLSSDLKKNQLSSGSGGKPDISPIQQAHPSVVHQATLAFPRESARDTLRSQNMDAQRYTFNPIEVQDFQKQLMQSKK